jgi:hypothetical protein
MSQLQRTTATPPTIRGVRFTEFGGPLGYAGRRRARPFARALGTGPAQEVV